MLVPRIATASIRFLYIINLLLANVHARDTKRKREKETSTCLNQPMLFDALVYSVQAFVKRVAVCSQS